MRGWWAIVIACQLTGMLPASGEAQRGNARSARLEQLLNQGRRLHEAGNSVSAVAYFRDAVQTAPNDPRGYEALGRAYIDTGSLSDALAVFQSGVRRRPDVAGLWLGMADALQAAGELDQAASALRDYAARDPAHVAVQLARARIAERRGAWSEALSAYRAAVERLARDSDIEALQGAQRRARALRVLVGDLDPVESVRNCRRASLVRRALARCEEPR